MSPRAFRCNQNNHRLQWKKIMMLPVTRTATAILRSYCFAVSLAPTAGEREAIYREPDLEKNADWPSYAVERRKRKFLILYMLSHAGSASFNHFTQTQVFFLFFWRQLLSVQNIGAWRINFKIDGSPVASRSHTHPSHSQTSRLLTSSLS